MPEDGRATGAELEKFAKDYNDSHSPVTPAEAFEGDRGKRVVSIRDVTDHFYFGEAVKAYVREHPDTLVRVTSTLAPGQLGEITVRWWQRGTEQPR